MPIFEYNGKTYNVREEHIDSFMKQYPDATSVMERDGKKYRVKSTDYRTFMSEQAGDDGGHSTAATTQGSDNPVQHEEAHQPTPQEMQRFSAQLKRTTDSFKRTTDSLNERMDNIREYSSHFGNGNTVEGQMRFDAETGKMKREYLTPLGNRYTDKAVADAESFRFRQTADMSISGQLRRANLKLAELKAKRQQSAQRVHDEAVADYKENTAPLAAVLFADTYSARQVSDKENSALDVAIRQTEELIKDLEEQRDREQGKDVGFWRGFGRVAGDFRTWDFGMSDVRDAMTMIHADSYADEHATENEREAYNEMMGALYNKEQAEQAYGDNANFWNRAGVMTGYMPSFMLDFVLTGGGFDGISAVAKGSGRLATKVVGREAAREIAEQGFKSYVKKNGLRGLGTYATDWTIKALGTTADDLLIRAPLMTNTVQAGNTAADIIGRKLGNVVVKEDGSYDFSNDATWGDAIWQGEANAIIENYSEMFGAHLDPVMTLGNMSKLANVVGAKRLGNVLAKADAGALNGIMGQTQALFNKMGVSGYFGEVSEEYYGQLWRTMLNLDDAYQTNPDGSRTNLLATGQFHGDIWGGMALSMGLMGAGKHTINAASYTSMKHGVNKADAKVNEMLGSEIWEPLKATIDLTTNDNIGEIAELIVNDADFTDDEKAAVLDYMERSMYMRGLNLASVAQGRNAEQNPDVQQANESYLDGYNIEQPQEMNDAKNLYEYHRQRVSNLVDDDMMLRIDDDPISAIEFANSNEEWSDDERTSVIDYINAKQVYDGMIQRVRDDIDGRIDQSNAMVDARINRTTGMIQPATMKADDRRVYVINGNLVQYADGSGIDNAASDSSIIVRDAETGALEQVAPDAILNIDGEQDANEQKQIAKQQIKQQFGQEAADKIDGVASFNPGDTYTVTGEQGEMNVQIVANEAGIVDNGDGTVNATTDGTEIITIPKEAIQQQVDAANIARVAEFEKARAEENLAVKAAEQEAQRPTYTLNDTITLRDENGNSVRGSITAGSDADGRYEVYTENPINGQRVNLFTREDIDARLVEHNGTLYEQPAAVEEAPAATQTQIVEAPQQSAFERVPKDEQGNPLYEQADSDTAWDAIVEQTEGDENMAQTVANGMVADKEAALKKAEKTKSKGGATIAEKIAAEKERTANIAAAKQELDIWKQIANVSARRKADIETERRRQAEEAAAARITEEEKLRAEREEAERIEREALNGVPDIVDDTPKDARSRGYRRVSGHKIDRQEPLQPAQGKPVAIKFSNDAISNGRIAIIDASQLQPSHIQGQRNPLHFIDEAQPKERNDQASVVSATKIASHIRPEEITSSITAYTGAPTINARGEVIQGNNRGYSLRLMWTDFSEQAERYRQYLKGHAADFGLTAEDIDSVQNPVLVNMLDVDDDTAITLGQYVAQDTESGGVERIKPKNTLQKMGTNMRTFANMLLKSTDDETSFAGLVDRNGTEVLKWMNTQGFITATQFKSAFDSKGNLTPEAKNDLRGIMYNSIFQDGSTLLEEMFNAMPAKAQKAILSTAYRDYDSPERMVEEIQNSIRAYYALSQDKLFAEATNFKDARMAVESWKRQYQIDDATGESYLPAENFSNFALHLATMYKGGTQSLIQGTFNKLYDLIQGAQEGNLFEQPDNTPRSLAQAINETLNFEYDGQQRSNVLAGNSAASQRGQQGSTGDAATGERIESEERTADSAGSIEAESATGGETVHQPQPGRKGFEQTYDVGRKADSTGVADDSTREVLGASNRGDLRVFEEGLDTSYSAYSDDSERTRRTSESERLVSVAKRHGLFIPIEVTKTLTDKVSKRTGESVVYINKEAGKVIKVKDPYAKAAMKSGVQPEDAAFEHLVHNLLFPETAYRLDGISEDMGDVRIVLSQDFIQNYDQPTKEQIAEALAARGLFPEDNYSFGNELVSVTDVEGDNVLLGEDGTVYFIDPIIRFKKPLREILAALGGAEQKAPSVGERVHAAEAEVNTTPTDAQKAAGNYKKGHVQVGTFNVTVENPKGSVRSGVDASGRKWQTTMNNTYGYIRGTEGVDGDHIDVFLSDDIDGWNGRRVFVIDQYNTDGTFDEHKVMLGFNSEEDATAAYLSNYEKSWADDHKTVCSSVVINEFEKWIDSSHRKTKPFADYKTVKHESVSTQEASTDAEGAAQQTDGYTVEKRFHKKNNTDIYAVKFTEQMPREQFLELKRRVKDFGGYYSSFGKGGFIFDREADARRFADAVLDPSGESLDDAAPLSLKDMRPSSGRAQVDAEGLMTQLPKTGEANLADHPTPVQPAEEKPEADKPVNPSGNKLVTDERYAELRERMRKKLGGQLNMGIDPEILAIGAEMAVYHIEKGARKFTVYASAMIADLGDAIRPYLKSFYNSVRDMPEAEAAGLISDMDSYDDVRRVDIANFDKNSTDPFATAEMVVAEQDMQAQAADAKQQIINQRNNKRRKENEQTTADTLALAEEAETVASEAEALAETATDEREIGRAVEQIDETLDRINDRLALLGYYEFDEDDSKFHESYGYMLTAEKKAVKDATNLAKQLVDDLGIKMDKVTSSTTPLGRKNTKEGTAVSANIAPAGGDITIRLPLNEGRELAIYIDLNPVAARGSRMRGDNLAVESIMYRIEEPAATGLDRYGINRWVFRPEEATYDYLLQLLRGEARKFLPGYRQQTKEEQEQAWRDMVAMAERGESPYTVTPEVEVELAKKRKDDDDTNSETVNGYRRGDEVLYDRNGNGKWEKQRIVDFEDGRPVLDSFGASWITEIADWERIKPVDGVFGEAERITRQMSEKKGEKKTSKRKVATDATIGNLFNIESEPEPTEEGTTTAPAIVVPEQRPAADLTGDSAAYQERETQTVKLVEEISGAIEDRVGMLEIDPASVKPLTMTDVKRMAVKYSALKDISDTDLQELVELAMTQLTRSEALANINGTAEAQQSAYDHIVNLYQIQPSLNARDSERLIKQQYSTPTPFGFVMGQFVRAGGMAVGSMLEPSAGNGALTIAVHPSLIHVNDIDDARLANLRKLGYGQVTAQDALLPFSGDKVDVVMTNPPFGTVTEKIYDDVFRISSLEGQMAINALEQMKDDGRAAIVIGGNTSYRTNGSMNPKDAAFFGYLYSHYNVVDVINISGKALYYRNGTGYDVRMILIDGRKTGEFQRVYPPVKAKARAEQITTFDELYRRIQDDIQQIQQVGSQPADVQRVPGTAADGTASAPVRSGNNRPNTGAGQRPGTTGDAVRYTSRPHSGQPSSANDGSRPVGVDNADTGNAGGTNNVPQPKPQHPRSVGSGSAQNGTGGSGSDGRGAVASRPDRSAERLEVKPDLTTEKVPYPNQSDNGFTLMSVVPAAQAQVLQKSLGEIGDVDQYLVDELGYSSKEELYSYLAAEQIDSVALAIHQMNKGNAFIIGDMTGVGKGRQGAALIRYAVKQGKVPIYFTQKPTLYTDNYRDLADIGSNDLRPFIIASNAKDANIVDADGNIVHKLPSKKEQERVFKYIMEHDTLPDGYDYVLTTYDQIKNGTADYSQNEDGTWNTEDRKLPKKSKGYTTADYNGQVRRDALARLAEGNITILDESHTVGGDSGCGRYMQMLTSQAEGVTFLSATFAKRADNMPIYAQRTAIAEAGVKASELIEAIIKGGVTLQEIMSKQLVESGQMIRRERSFEGVTIDWLSVAEETDRRQREQFNEVADIFNSIRKFQDDYITPIIDAKNEAAAEFGATVGHTQGTKDLGVKNVPFASKMYNLVNQLLFALKVDAVADRVVENLRNGFKPVISFTNTMEGFLSSAPKGVAMDDVPNFSLTLLRALDGVMRYTETDADENSEDGTISLSQLSTEGQNTYNAIRKKIMNLSADLPISPMDAIRMKIEEAGYSVAEITGRTMQLNRTDDGHYIVEARKDSDKKAAMRDFNAGKLDVLMINKSGSTGISLHASSKFEDQRPRVMVFAQFQSDINDEVQMRGRIDRSGQVTRGRYEYIMSTIPAEQRIQMMFKAKLKSLDANTTSSQKSKFNEMEIVDYLNKYGDEVVWDYMKEHPELEERLGDPLDMLQEKNTEDGPRTSEKEDTSKKSGCAGKISRYLAFLSVEEQDEIFREITESYRVKIQLLDDAGENDLEITTMPLRAETKRKQVWHEGENPGSGNAFADNTYVEEVEVDVLKKPMKRAEIEDATRKLMGDKLATATEYDQERYGMKEGELNWRRYVNQMQTEISQFFQTKADEAVGKLKETGEARIAKAREKAVRDATKARSRSENNFTDEEIQSLADTVANEAREKEESKQRKRREEIMAVKDRIKSLLTHFRAGSIYVVPQDLKQATLEMFSQTFGTFVGFKFNKSYTLGSSTAIFATLDGRRKVELALNDPAIQTIIGTTNIAYRYSPEEINAITMENWDSKVPTQTRQKRYIITGNLLQALVDTEKAEKTKGNLISFSTIDGEIRQGILMGENFKLTDLLNSASLSSRLAQIREGQSVVSENGDVQIEKVTSGWQHRGDYELRVPKSKQRGGIYTMHPDLLKLVDGHNFITKGNNMVAYVTEADIAKVLDMLSRAPFNLTVLQESNLSDASTDEVEDDVLMRDSDTMYRIREDAAPTKTGIGYKVFVLKNGKLYPPMVANPNGDATPFGVWLDADAAPITGQSKTGRNQVKAGGKGTQGGSGKLAYRPGWHLGEIPYALQFNRNDETGERNLFPANFVWAEVEYADDVDYQDEAMSYGINPRGKFQHSLAGLPRVPKNGAYRYRTNPNPETDPWIITGAMRVNRLLTPSEVDAMVEAAGREPQHRQEGAITDEQITGLNAELQQQAVEDSVHPKAARREMAEQVYNLAKKLNLDNVEVVTRVSGLQGKKATVKGFYTKSTGKITVVIPNNTSLADAQRTLLHEAVAHYGLRQMFGAQFNTFLDNVFNNADRDVRERIVALAAKNGWDFRKATEEYLAQLAENTEFEQARQSSWWQKIKDFFVDMLNKIGFADFDGATLTDNELRYILWRSYENLKEGAHSSVFSEAADTAKQYELNVGEFDPENDILRRDGDPEMHERALARDRYEQRVRSGMFQSREAIQDSMLGLKEAMLAILGEKTYIEDVDGFENAYLGENRLSSVNKAEADAFAHTLFKPMLNEVARLAPTEREREELTDYMMAKHGLERNRVMAERDARKAVDAGSKKSYDELLEEFRKNDYAGLTALTGLDEVDEAEAEAELMVADYENDRETDDLWEKVNAVSKAILQKSYECGMMDKQTFEAVSDMYEFYIPLRGFDEKTSAEAYAYLSHRQSAFNAPIKRALGRKSKADDPFANLQSMAESAIVQGNRNKLVKQKFLNFVLNHPSDLVSVSDLWLQYDDVVDEWRPVFPDNIDIDDTPDEVERKMQEFEAKMSSLAEADPNTYKRGRDAVNIPYRVVESRDLRQHQVIVKRNGRDYLLTINGNPRAAQALNGQTNPDNDTSGAIGAILRAGEKINRQLSAFYTTRNPDFIVSNFVRDLLYSNVMTWVKESPNYALRYHRNYITKANPMKMKSLLSRYRKGTLNMNDSTDAMFHQFMMNGGETGYANVRDIEQHKNDIRKELRKANGKLKIPRAMELLGERFDELNRAIENCARFAAFITSREMGRSIDRAIYDAKEISVNFNKKGSGAKFYDATGQTLAGNGSALVSGLGRSGFVFWNAAIQGTTNFGKQLKRHPAKAYTGAAAMFLLGVLIAYLGGDDDDDDKNAYYNLPEYVRRSNILFSIGDHWISIPLPIEFRAFYGMGELMTSLFSGKEHLTDGEIAEAIAGQATQILPIDFLEGGGGLNAFIPSSVKPLWEAYVVEKSWTGMPLYKNTPYNKDMPEWTKAYSNANRYIVGLANALNESTGGDAYTKGVIDLNPAKIEYMLNGYFGGVFGTIDKLTKTAETIVGAREYDPRSILLMNRLVKAGDERTEFRAVNKEYFRLKEEHDRLKARLKHYEDDTDNGVFDYAEKIDFLYNSPEYERYEIFEDYRQDIDDLYEELKETVDDEERKEIEAELNEVKKEMISEINLTRNRK